MATAIRFITRIQDTDDYGDAHTWAGAHTFNAGISIASGQGITMADDDWIGIGAAAERIVFDAAGDISFMGASVGIGTLSPNESLEISGGRLRLPQADTEATPALNFGDGDSGLYEVSDDVIAISLGGVRKYLFNSAYFALGTNTGNPQIIHQAAGATFPGFSFWNDGDTGVGRAATNVVCLIGGGVNVLNADGNGNVGIGVLWTSAKCDIDQSSATGARPVLQLDQADVDYVMIKFIGTAQAASADRTLVADSDFGTPGALVGWIQVEIQDDGNRVSDGDYYIPFYATPT